MALSDNQPTILVKRADGTTVRMTLDELKNMKKEAPVATLPAAQPVVPPPAPVKEIKPRQRDENVLSIVELEQKRKKNEMLQTHRQITDKEIARVQTEDLSSLTKPEALSITEIPLYDDEEPFSKNWEADDHKSLLDDSFHNDKLPSLIKDGGRALTNASPVKDIFVDEAEAKVKEMKNKEIESKPVIKPVAPKIVPIEPPVKLPPKPIVPKPMVSAPKPLEIKPVMQEIVPPIIEKQSVGPLDELRSFTLIDFRRLDMNPHLAGEKLLEKLKILEHDSFLFFMEGVEAWYNSPLYRQYKDVIAQSLKRNKSVGDILLELNPAQNLKVDGFKAILHINEIIG